MKNCPRCGAQVSENNVVCPICGAQLTATASGYQQNQYNPYQPMQQKTSGKALAGFIVSLVGMILFAIPCGIVGTILCSMGMKESEMQGFKGKGFAVAGLVLSIIDIIFGILLVMMMNA